MLVDSGTSRALVDALPVEIDYVPEKLKIKARDELCEDEDKVTQTLKSLKSMLRKEPNLRWQDDDLFLLAFLRVRKFDVERTFNHVKSFYTKLGRHGEHFYNLNFDRLRQMMEENLVIFLPYRDDEGSVIFVVRPGPWDPEVTSAVEHTTCTFMGIVQALRNPATQIAGFHMVFDFTGFTFKHLTYVTASILKFFTDMIQNGLPIRLQGLHLVNQNHLFSYIWPVVKIFLSKKLRDRVHFHGTDMNSLHRFFNPSILPAQLGGEMPPYDNTDWRQRMEVSEDYLKDVLSYGYENYLRKDWKKKS